MLASDENEGAQKLYRGPMGNRGPPIYYDGNGASAGPYVGSDNGGFGGGFGPTGGSFGSAGSSSFGGFGNADGSDRPKRTGCFNCGEPGHLSKDCNQPRKQRTECFTGERPKRGCYNCGEEGHNSRECPKPPREPPLRGGGRGGFSSAFRGSGGERPKRGGYYNLNYPDDGAHSPRGGPKSREDTRRSWNHPRMSSIHAYGGGRGRGGGGGGGFSRFGPPGGNGDAGGFSNSANNCYGPTDGGFAGGGFGGGGGFGPGPVAGGLMNTKNPGPYVNNGGFSNAPPPPPPFGGYHPPTGFGSTNSVASKSDSGELGFGNGSRRGEQNSGGFVDSDDEQSAVAVPTSVKRTGPVSSSDAGFRFQGDLVFFAKDFAAGKPQGQLCSNCNSEWHLTKDCTNLRKSASSNMSVPDDEGGDLRKSILPKIERLCTNDDLGEMCEKSLTPGGGVICAVDKPHHPSDSSSNVANSNNSKTGDLPATAPKSSSQAPNSDIRQSVEQVDADGKLDRLTELLQSDIENCAPTSPEGKYAKKTLVFVERKRTADYLASVLSQRNVCSTSFHNDREQSQRDQAISDFKYGHCSVMVVNAISARTLDIVGVDHVINYDLPKMIDDYVQRVGRTGRAGSPGKATSFYDESNDGGLLRDLAKVLSDAQQTVPDWMQNGGGGTVDFGLQRFNLINPIGSDSKPVVWC